MSRGKVSAKKGHGSAAELESKLSSFPIDSDIKFVHVHVIRMPGKVYIESWVCLSVTVYRITVQILIATATVQLLKGSKNMRRQTKNIWWVNYLIQLMNICVSWWSAEGHFRGQWSGCYNHSTISSFRPHSLIPWVLVPQLTMLEPSLGLL